MTAPLIEADHLVKQFPLSRSLAGVLLGEPEEFVHAVDDVSLEIHPGETLGLIGESGSGKTTLGWLLAKLLDATGGRIRFEGWDITGLSGRDLLAWRRNVQVVFQDPVGSLDPRFRVWQVVGEPILAQEDVSRPELKARVAELLPLVGLPAGVLDQCTWDASSRWARSRTSWSARSSRTRKRSSPRFRSRTRADAARGTASAEKSRPSSTRRPGAASPRVARSSSTAASQRTRRCGRSRADRVDWRPVTARRKSATCRRSNCSSAPRRRQARNRRASVDSIQPPRLA